MKIKDFKEKVNASIEVPDVLDKINEKRDRSYTYEPVKKPHKSSLVFLKVGIGLAVVVIAAMIIIPLLPLSKKSMDKSVKDDEAQYEANAQDPESALSPSASDGYIDIDSVYSEYLSSVQEQADVSLYKGTLTEEDVNNINQYIVNNKLFVANEHSAEEITEEICESFNYSEDLKDDVNLVVRIIDDK